MAVVATAGHVDHGKSTLVRLLTGQEPDRWAEERRRGLTIDLGYAWTDIDERRVSLVDVPGHEHFTGNMLAGLGPVSAVMFVVAADDGWCPQSEEHARAIAALGIEHVLVVVTRCDLAPGASSAQEAAARFASLGVSVAETVLVSGATGEGLPELRAGLGRLAAAAERSAAGSRDADPSDADPDAEPSDAEPSDAEPSDAGSPPDRPRGTHLRLWVDRSFTIRGAGTVVTGTLSAGRIEVGTELVLHGAPVRVRGLQTCGEDAPMVVGPARVAVNLRGVEVAQVGRGAALLDARWPAVVTLVDVILRPLDATRPRPGAPANGTGDAGMRWQDPVAAQATRPVENRLPRELTLHVGTAAVPVRTQVRADGRVRLRLATGLPLVAGDRAVLRDPGRHEVLAGVDIRVVDPPRPPRPRQRRPASRPRTARDDAPAEATDSVAVEAGASAGMRELVKWLGAHPLQAPTSEQLEDWAPTPQELASAATRGVVLRIGGVLLGPDALRRAAGALRSLGASFTVGEAARAMGTSRRVAVPLLERLDATLVTRRLPDGRRELR